MATHTLDTDRPTTLKPTPLPPARHRRPSPGWLFVGPAMIYLLLLAVFPLLLTIHYSLREITVGGLRTGQLPWAGLDNFGRVFGDPSFWTSLRVTAVFTVASVVFQLTIGMALAILFRRAFPGRNAYRAIVMLGWILPLMVVGTTFKWMFQSGNGVINAGINLLGAPSIPWLESPTSALIAVTMANIWLGIPFTMSMLLAGLQTISPGIYEAARIDGASNPQQFLYITLPQMRGPILVVLTLSIIYTFNVFEIILAMTGGGPGTATSVVSYYSYLNAFQFFEIGNASAATVVLMMIMSVVSAAYLWVLNRSEDNS